MTGQNGKKTISNTSKSHGALCSAVPVSLILQLTTQQEVCLLNHSSLTISPSFSAIRTSSVKVLQCSDDMQYSTPRKDIKKPIGRRVHLTTFKKEQATRFQGSLGLKTDQYSAWPMPTPYSRKFLREKTFTNFTVLEPPAKVFSTKFGHAVPTNDRF